MICSLPASSTPGEFPSGEVLRLTDLPRLAFSSSGELSSGCVLLFRPAFSSSGCVVLFQRVRSSSGCVFFRLHPPLPARVLYELGCNLVSHCCNSYEYYVSCCLDPSRTEKDLALKVKIAKPITAGKIFILGINILVSNCAQLLLASLGSSRFMRMPMQVSSTTVFHYNQILQVCVTSF